MNEKDFIKELKNLNKGFIMIYNNETGELMTKGKKIKTSDVILVLERMKLKILMDEYLQELEDSMPDIKEITKALIAEDKKHKKLNVKSKNGNEIKDVHNAYIG